jgi:hypothetical protein
VRSIGLRRRFDDRRDKAVALRPFRLDESRRRRQIPDRITYLPDRDVEAVVEVDECIVGPELLPELLTGDELTMARYEHPEDLPRLILQADSSPRSPEVTRRRIELERAKSHEARLRCEEHTAP